MSLAGGIGSVIGAGAGGALGFLGAQEAGSFSGLDEDYKGTAKNVVGGIDRLMSTPFNAPSNSMINSGIQAGFDVGQQTQGFGQPVAELGLQTAQGQFADINNNEYAQNAINAGTSQVARDFMERVLPGLESAAISQGAFGGSRNGIVNMLAAERSSRQAQELASQVANQFYQSERDRMMQSGNLIAQGQQVGLNAADTQLGAGLNEQAQADRQLRNLFEQVDAASTALSRPAFQISQSKGDPFLAAIQGAGGGAALGGALGDVVGGFF